MHTKIDFIEGNTKRCLLSMAFPMIAAMFLTMAYNLVDSLWIGNLLGETAYAALTNSTPIILIVSSIAMGMTNGISIQLSQAIGAKEQEKAESIITTSLIVSVILSIVITAVLEALLNSILIFLHTPKEIFQMAYEYLSIYLLGYLAVYLFCYFTAVLRSFGDSIFQMKAILICTILNAILNPLFIYALGLKGSAIATLLSQSLCLLFMLFYLKKRKFFSFHISAFHRSYIGAYFTTGIPSALQQSIPAFSTGFLTSLVSGYGISAIAAYGVTGKLESILFYPAMALNMVLTIIVGQCAGAKRFDRVRDYIKLSLKYGVGLLILLSFLIILFAPNLSALFVNSEKAAEIVGQYFKIVGGGYVLYTISSCYLGAVNGMGKPIKSMLCMIIYFIVVRIPLAGFFSYMGWGLNSIWSAVLISHVVAVIAAVVIGNVEIAFS